MKGLVFCEFLGMVDSQMSPEMTETIIEKSGVPSGGAYTAVGTYDHSEIIALVVSLSKETGISVPVLVNTFGHYLFDRFVEKYERFFADNHTCFDFIEKVGSQIHVEVHKLYPDAKLPEIETRRPSENELHVTYRSNRPLGDLAEGLLQAAVNHYREAVRVLRHTDEPGSENVVNFTLQRMGAAA